MTPISDIEKTVDKQIDVSFPVFFFHLHLWSCLCFWCSEFSLKCVSKCISFCFPYLSYVELLEYEVVLFQFRRIHSYYLRDYICFLNLGAANGLTTCSSKSGWAGSNTPLNRLLGGHYFSLFTLKLIVYFLLILRRKVYCSKMTIDLYLIWLLPSPSFGTVFTIMCWGMAPLFVYSSQEWTVLLEHEDLGLLSILGNVKPLSLQILLFLIPFRLYL